MPTEYEAGEELDRLIAEQVIGDKLPQAWADASVGASHGDPGGYRIGVKPYSTDIAAAWEALTYLEEVLDFAWTLSNNEPGYTCRLYNNVFYEGCVGKATTVPLAICRAALLTVELPTRSVRP